MIDNVCLNTKKTLIFQSVITKVDNKSAVNESISNKHLTKNDK